MNFFQNIKVVELASVLAGPLVGSFFAELGAKVVKIEHPGNGDITRSWKLKSENAETPISAYYAAANYGKINKGLHAVTDYDAIVAEIADADIVISNFKGQHAQKFKLDANTLCERFPQLIYLELKGFASDEHRLAFDVVLQAECAFISMTGTDEVFAKMPVAFIDLLAAHQLKEAALIALIQRMHSQKGAYWKTSLEEVALSSLANQASNYLMEGFVAGRIGTLHPNIAPYGDVLYAQNKVPFVLAVGNDQHFLKLLEILDLQTIFPAWDHNQKRLQNRSQLMEILNEKAQHWPAQDLEKALLTHHIPAGRIKRVDEALNTPTAQKLILHQEIEGVATQRLKSFVVEQVF